LISAANMILQSLSRLLATYVRGTARDRVRSPQKAFIVLNTLNFYFKSKAHEVLPLRLYPPASTTIYYLYGFCIYLFRIVDLTTWELFPFPTYARYLCW